MPLSPGRQAQPDGTLIPDERVGQATAVHVKDVGKACEKPEQADDDDVTGENPGEQMGATGDPFVEPTGQPATVLLPLLPLPLPLPLPEIERQFPFESEKRPWALQLAMRASCRVRALLTATL